MHSNKLIIIINKSVEEVFEFTVNPNNTPKWIDSIKREEVDSFPIEVDVQYTNWDKDNKQNSYWVTEYQKNKVFQLDSVDGEYKVRYTYTPISGNKTQLEYFEWQEGGELESPFTQETMEKLKDILEEQ